MQDNYRPYEKETAQRIIERVNAGQGTLKACNAENVSIQDFFRWEKAIPALAGELAAARVKIAMKYRARLSELIAEAHAAAGDTEKGRLKLRALQLEADIIKWTLEHDTRISCDDFRLMTQNA